MTFEDSSISSLHATYWPEFDFFNYANLTFELLTFQIGESPVSHSPNTCIYFLLSGSVRELLSSNNINNNRTLALYSPPYILSEAYLSGDIDSKLICSTECQFISVQKNDLYTFLESYDGAISVLQSYTSHHDLWCILLQLLPELSRLPYTQYKAHFNSLLSRLTSFSFTNSTDDNIIDFEKNFYFIGETVGNYIYGNQYTVNKALNNHHPLRLLKISKSSISQFSSTLQLYPTDASPSLASSVPETSQSPEKNPLKLEPAQNVPTDNAGPTRIKFFESTDDKTDIAIACFRSLAYYFNLPIKKDVISSSLKDFARDNNGVLNLAMCSALAETLGLQTQSLRLPISFISRLVVPAFIQFANGEICVAFKNDKNGTLVSRPASGLSSLQKQDLLNLCDDDQCLNVLIFRTTDLTPTKKFGLSWFIPSLRRHRRSLIEVFIASFFVQLFQLMNPLIVQQIIDKVIGQGGSGTLPVLAFLIFTFSLFENLLTALRTNLFIETTNRIDISLGEQVIDHLLRLPLSYFDKRPVGELSSRLAELEQIRSFLTGTALTVVLDVLFSIIYILVMLLYSWILTIVALLVAPLLAVITFSVSPLIRAQLRTKAQLNAKTQNHLVEILTGIQTVKAQNFETDARARWKDRYSRYISEGFKNAVTSTTANSFTQFLNQASSLLVLCVGAFLVINGYLTLGQLIAFRIISGYVTTPLLRLSNLYQNFQQTSISLERLADIIDFPSESSPLDKENIPMPKIIGHVQYSDVSFRFKSDTPLQLSGVSLDILPGEFVAIVGKSGSGKSTLTKLLPRLYPPASGRVFIDDLDISKVELYSLRSQIGIVPQDSLLFGGSVQDNISLTNPNASSDDIIRASKLACAHDFIMSLPSGYATSVGERGGSLSGGQRQRIAIARSILQDPRLLIMDEATSALDYETERSVSLNLMDHFRGRTVFFITHRLSSIVHADKIILMHDGQVDDIGTHDELMSRKGRYYALYNQQGMSTV